MNWQTCTLADVMGDGVVYRNLEPMRRDIPGLRTAWAEVGLGHYYVPRKTDPEYATALMHYLKQAQQARGIKAPLERLLFIGDTLMLDGSAAHNVGKHLPLLGFIGAERSREPAKIDIQSDLMVANRWGALADFVHWLDEMHFGYDERTALLIDLDKTSLGARGRNDKVIDEARVQAIYRTMRNTLGAGFDEVAFRQVYDALNVPKYHAFTADNQDYLAYVCLMVIGGVCPAEEMWRDLASGALSSIQQFVTRCDGRQSGMAAGLLAAHQEVYQGIKIGDPTPFKAFRRVEYLETVGRMNRLPQDAEEGVVLGQEIVITAEVTSIAAYMAKRGVLIFGISDKPDEASLPTVEHAAQGYQPLHRTTMKIYGNSLF
jgi:hypothetical protein